MTPFADYVNPYNQFWNDYHFDSQLTTFQATCKDRWNSGFFQYMSTAPWISSWTPWIDVWAVLVTESSSTVTTTSFMFDVNGVDQFGAFFPQNFVAFPFTASSPCCGRC